MLQAMPSVGIYTLGCKVNQYESEAIAEALTAHGFSLRPHEQKCDIYIINTCTVTAESDRKAGQFIRRAIAQNPNAYIIVTGCLSQTDPHKIAQIKGVDFVGGNDKKMNTVAAALRYAENRQKRETPEISVSALDEAPFEGMQIQHFNRTRAYVKIEDGCENHCTYCIIPAARGKVRSKPPQEVIREVQALVANGCREVVLTGIETASYGKDLKDCRLEDLLAQVNALTGVERIRLGSLDPSLITERFVAKLSSLSSLMPHFHLSLQSGCDRTLARMKRKYNARMAMEAMERVRAAIPEVCFTTDVIVGFPGETEEDFAETVSFMKKARFLNAHIFPYSRREGTPAAVMPDQVPEAVKSERSAALIAVQADIHRALLREQVAQKKKYDVLFETESDGFFVGHTPSFIEVAVKSPVSLRGEIQRVRAVAVEKDRLLCELLPSSEQERTE